MVNTALMAFQAGYAYPVGNVLTKHYRFEHIPRASGRAQITMDGNQALAYGLIAGGVASSAVIRLRRDVCNGNFAARTAGVWRDFRAGRGRAGNKISCQRSTKPYRQDTLHKEYLELLEKEITKAFVYSYQEQADALFQNYLDHAEAYVNKTRVKDRNTREELQPDEGFLKSVEEQIAIIGSAADGFRQEVIAYLWAASRRGERVTYQSYEPLKEAIEKKLMSSGA